MDSENGKWFTMEDGPEKLLECSKWVTSMLAKQTDEEKRKLDESADAIWNHHMETYEKYWLLLCRLERFLVTNEITPKMSKRYVHEMWNRIGWTKQPIDNLKTIRNQTHYLRYLVWNKSLLFRLEDVCEEVRVHLTNHFCDAHLLRDQQLFALKHKTSLN